MVLQIVLIGAGKWGKNYIKTIKDNFPNINLIIANKNNWKQLLDNKPNGAIIATQPEYHIEIACHALENNVPIIIEKPLCFSLDEANKLLKYKSTILINYIHLFSDSFQLIKKISKDKINIIISNGFNNGPIRNYSALFDYAPHDIAMILDLLNKFPDDIKIYKNLTTHGELYNIIMKFNNIYTSSKIGSGSLYKERNINIYFDDFHIIFDNLKSKDKLLINVINSFIKSFENQDDYRLGLKLSLQVTEILEICSKQLIKNNEQAIDI